MNYKIRLWLIAILASVVFGGMIYTITHPTPRSRATQTPEGVENFVQCVDALGNLHESNIGDNWKLNATSGMYSADRELSYRPLPGDSCAVHEVH